MRWGLAIELLHWIAGLIVTYAIFAGAAWAYPQGHGTIWPVGWLTMAAVTAMCAPAIMRAWRRGAGA